MGLTENIIKEIKFFYYNTIPRCFILLTLISFGFKCHAMQTIAESVMTQ